MCAREYVCVRVCTCVYMRAIARKPACQNLGRAYTRVVARKKRERWKGEHWIGEKGEINQSHDRATPMKQASEMNE